MRLTLILTASLLMAPVALCGHGVLEVRFEDTGDFEFGDPDRRRITEIIAESERAVRAVMPALPSDILVTVVPVQRDLRTVASEANAYPENVDAWTIEILGLPADADYAAWMFEHPDGRLAIGYRTGRYIVHQAMLNSGRFILELSELSPDRILDLAAISARVADGPRPTLDYDAFPSPHDHDGSRAPKA